MTRPSTSRDVQRATFVESLHNSLKKQAAEAIADHKRFIILANSYIQDNLEEAECIELLMIDGLTREAAESFTSMALTQEEAKEERLPQYNFRFEDVFGRIWSSCDIGKTIEASNDNEAWEKAEELLASETDVEFQKILSVSRVN